MQIRLDINWNLRKFLLFLVIPLAARWVIRLFRVYTIAGRRG